MMKTQIFLILFLLVFEVRSQPVLKPHIGLNSIPADSDSMCVFPTYTGGFGTSGYQVGDTVNDFTLFSHNGDTLNLRSELMKGKPVVLISCSYTCPVFRNKIDEINNLFANNSDSVSIFIVYTIEAHPFPDISPYFGFVNVGQQNISEGIIFPQPRTYGERKTMVYRLDSARDISAAVFIDGPCNAWLSYFGPAPNNAYLIDTTGIVFAKHAWFNRTPDNMTNDINRYFGNGGGGGFSTGGTFSFSYTSDSLVQGFPGEVLYGHGQFVNTSDSGVYIKVIRDRENLPAGWATSICIDLCLSPEIDSVTFYLPPRDTQSYTMYFYTSPAPGSGSVRMRFRNLQNPDNRFTGFFYCMTDSSITSVINTNVSSELSYTLYQNYPNPFNPETNISFFIPKSEFVILKIYDIKGMEVSNPLSGYLVSGYHNFLYNARELPSGVYFFSLRAGAFTDVKKFVVLK